MAGAALHSRLLTIFMFSICYFCPNHHLEYISINGMESPNKIFIYQVVLLCRKGQALHRIIPTNPVNVVFKLTR